MSIWKAICAVSALLVLCGAGCGSEPTAMVADRPVISSPQPAPTEVTIALDRAIVQLQVGTQVGTEGCAGVSIGTPINWRGGDHVLNLATYRTRFNQELGAVGFGVNQTRSVFERDEARAPTDLIVGAGIPEVKLNRCDPVLYAAALGTLALMMKRSADATISVDWEIFDPVERKVVFRVRTQGQGTATQGTASVDVAMENAFQQAARNLARDEGFRTAVAKYKHPDAIAHAEPNPGAPMGTNAGGGGSNVPAGPHLIANIPLSTTPFSDHVTDIRANVATVLVNGAFGSGFFISEDLLLTNHHVVTDLKFVKVKLVTGRELVGEVLAADAPRDVALIRTEKTGLKGLPLRAEEPGIGSQVFVIGTPLDRALESSVSAGIIGAYRELRNHRFLQSDVNIRQGNSGGPMFDDKGNVIAISDLARQDRGNNAGINFFIPIGDALQTLDIAKRAQATAAVSSR